MSLLSLAAPVLGFAGKVFGGLFGKKKKAPTRVTPRQIRAEALDGGFNPLTVLRGAGGGGFGFNPTPVPTLSSAEVIGDALGSLSHVIDRFDPIKKRTAELENELLEERLKAAKESSRQVAERRSDLPGGMDISDAIRTTVIDASPVARRAIGDRRIIRTNRPTTVEAGVSRNDTPLADTTRDHPKKAPTGRPYDPKLHDPTTDVSKLETADYLRVSESTEGAADRAPVGDPLLVRRWDPEKQRWILTSPAQDLEEAAYNWWQRNVTTFVNESNRRGRENRKREARDEKMREEIKTDPRSTHVERNRVEEPSRKEKRVRWLMRKYKLSHEDALKRYIRDEERRRKGKATYK